jgi:hypothetical protein
VRCSGPSSQLRRAGVPALKVDHGGKLARHKAEENQGQSSRDSRHPPKRPS